MSHYTQLHVEFTDGECLRKALESLGFAGHVEVYSTAQNLYGYQGDLRAQKAHIIIRKKHVGQASNDLGFERQASGRFVAHVSDYDARKYDKAWFGKLKQAYTVEKTAKGVMKQGWNVFQKIKKADGTVQFVLVKN